jgi:hypothetical protein
VADDGITKPLLVMSAQPDPSHHVRRVVLPSGRTIEVVYFDSSETATGDASSPQRDLQDLHVCTVCSGELVYPVEWEEVSSTHWEVALRCPSCEHFDVGVFDQETVDRFDEELDHGTELLVRDLKRLTRANMEEEIDRFAAALNADAIWPMDF